MTSMLKVALLGGVLFGLAAVVLLWPRERTGVPIRNAQVAQTTVQAWIVWKGDRQVQRVADTPGRIASAAYTKPNIPPKHPFLSTTSLDVFEEESLYQVLQRARSIEEYLRLLQEQGYRVERE